MNYKKWIQCIIVAFIFLCSSGCSKEITEESPKENTSLTSEVIQYEEDDAYQEVHEDSAITINLDEQVGDVQLTTAGTYILQGTLIDGSIRVNVGKEETVRLVLDNASISSSTFAAIYCAQAKKLIVSLPEGTNNTLSDGIKYSGVVDEEPSATLFAKDDMSINGTGTLTITSNYNDAITAKDTLKIIEGSYVITSNDDGIVGRDALYIHSGTYTIHANGDGIKTTYDTDESKGDMIIEDGTFQIVVGNDGIQGEHKVSIYDGTYTIETGGGSINSSTSANVNQSGGFGRWQETTTTVDEVSAKGIKAGTSLTLAQGTYTLDTSDDAIHCNGDILIRSGNYVITSGDDGIHSNTLVQIDGGCIDIQKSYEGIEGSILTFNAGDIQITSSDDGINAGGGNDGSSTGRMGENSFASSENIAVNIHGGNIQIDANGDGLDSNGIITMDGGTVIVSGSSNAGNGALDYDQSFSIDGGILIATGMSAMAQTTSTTSSQPAILIQLESMQEAYSTFYIQDDTTLTQLGIAPVKSFDSVLISAPSLSLHASISAYANAIGGNSNDAGYIESGNSGGTLIDSVELTSVVSTIGKASTMMGHGGMRK